MGAWGPGLYSDDVTEDVRGIYVDKLHRGKNGEQASKEMIAEFEWAWSDNEGSGYMKKFSTEEITNIISNETNIWEQFKQNMKRWEKKLEVYGINIKLEQYWENNIYDPDEIFNERVEFRAGYQYYCSFVLLKDGKEIDSEKVFMGGEYMFVEIQNKCIFPRLSKKFCDFNKLSLYLTMYTMEEGKIWIEDDMKEILKIIKEGKYYIGTENREED